MIRDIELDQLLQVWLQTADITDPQETQDIEAHLDEQTLYDMVQPSGLATARPEYLAHLSACPHCLQEFGAWHEALIDGTETEAQAPLMSYGLRQAAASDGVIKPQTLTSTCGRFILGIYPEVDHPQRGMVTLDLSKGSEDLHGKIITVRDANATLLLDGSLQRGRLARIIDNLDEIDLASWTISEQEPKS